MKPSILNIAHRGASGTSPENTVAAFRAAIAAGAAMCELDVQPTRDHALVVIHDDTVYRTTDGQGAVKEMTLLLDPAREERVEIFQYAIVGFGSFCFAFEAQRHHEWL